MSNNNTWTYEQLQAQLDEWTSELEHGGVPDMTLAGTHNFETILLHYTLHFGPNKIELSKHQAENVIEWMNKHFKQCERNRISNQNRATHFAGFAKAVVDELLNLVEPLWDLEDTVVNWEDRGLIPMRNIIARRAYDLVIHAVDNVDSNWLDAGWSSEETVCYVPDLPVLPEEKQQNG